MDHLSFTYRPARPAAPRRFYARRFEIAFWLVICSAITGLVATTAWMLAA